ncbi:MAG: phosphodiester glycosidase family protein, partial [Akkermansia sp.]|nr:phosphodiester glycosidase family protein [Akkermansia sp.]
IALGDTIRVETNFSPDISKLKESIGGNTLLVKDGKLCNFTSNITGKNQRTAIGTSGNTLYFVTVDGRKPDCPGFTQETLAQLMIELGCDTAINLDGGGSTTMVTEDLLTGKQKVVNDVSSLRRVSNAIGVISTLSPLSIAQGGQLELSKYTIVSGDSISVSYGFYDENYNRIPATGATISTSDKSAAISGYLPQWAKRYRALSPFPIHLAQTWCFIFSCGALSSSWP